MLTLLESPTALPVSLNKVKKYLRIDHDEDDAQLKLLISAATSLVEQETGRSLLLKTWQLRSSGQETPEGLTRLTLSFPPLVSVQSVGTVVGATKITPLKRYVVEWERTIPAVLLPASGRTFEVVYKAGYGEKPSDIPPPLRQAIMMLVAEMYEHRSSTAKIDDTSLVKVFIKPFCLQTFI